MKTTLKSLCVALIALHPTYSSAEQETAAPSVKDLMKPEQYKAAGMDKLTGEERAALATWLHEYMGNDSVAVTVAPAAEELAVPAAPVTIAPSRTEEVADAESIAEEPDKNWGFSKPPREKSAEKKVLYANIVGSFRGWTGKTVFHLDNGQVWRQRRSGRFNYTGDARRVVIGKNSWGFFEMRLIAADRAVGVSRVK
ncbi:MAG: hypothetical protein ACR2PZ_25590 [Pseudomonadales bacterium]